MKELSSVKERGTEGKRASEREREKTKKNQRDEISWS